MRREYSYVAMARRTRRARRTNAAPEDSLAYDAYLGSNDLRASHLVGASMRNVQLD
jgi:hypothetical protein